MLSRVDNELLHNDEQRLFFSERKVHPSMSEGKLYFVFSGLNQAKTWLRSYSWIGVQRLVRFVIF